MALEPGTVAVVTAVPWVKVKVLPLMLKLGDGTSTVKLFPDVVALAIPCGVMVALFAGTFRV